MGNKKLKLSDLEVQSFVTSEKRDEQAVGGTTVHCIRTTVSLLIVCTNAPDCPGSTQCAASECANCPHSDVSDCLCSFHDTCQTYCEVCGGGGGGGGHQTGCSCTHPGCAA